MVFLLVTDGSCRLPALALCLANDLEESDWDETPGGRDGGVASFVPVGIVLPAEDVEEIALVKGQLVRMVRLGLVIVQRFDDLDCVDVQPAES